MDCTVGAEKEGRVPRLTRARKCGVARDLVRIVFDMLAIQFHNMFSAIAPKFPAILLTYSGISHFSGSPMSFAAHMDEFVGQQQ